MTKAESLREKTKRLITRDRVQQGLVGTGVNLPQTADRVSFVIESGTGGHLIYITDDGYDSKYIGNKAGQRLINAGFGYNGFKPRRP